MTEDTIQTANSTEDLFFKNILDPLAWSLAKLAIDDLTQQTVNWINNGFENPDGTSAPHYIINTEAYLGLICNTSLTAFVQRVGESETDPQVSRIMARTLRKTQPCAGKRVIRPTISDALFDSFMEDVEQQINWNSWRSVMGNPLNNPYGRYLESAAQLDRELSEESQRELRELDWASGFLSQKECREVETSVGRGKVCETVTPGVSIERRLSKALNTDLTQLELADNFNEIIGAFATQILKQVFSRDGNLRYGSSGGSSTHYGTVATAQSVIEQQREKVRELIINQRDTETAYKSAKDTSLARIAEGRTALKKIADATYIVEKSKVLDEKSTMIKKDLEAVQPLLDELDTLDVQLNNAETTEAISAMVTTIQTFQNTAHDRQDVTAAQNESLDIDRFVREIENTALGLITGGQAPANTIPGTPVSQQGQNQNTTDFSTLFQ